MSTGINNQYDFFKKICLDENGLLCGIQEVINGLQSLTFIQSGNTEAINEIKVTVNELNNNVVEINSNVEELNGIVTELKDCSCDNLTEINDTVQEINNKVSNCTTTTPKPPVCHPTPPSNCKPKPPTNCKPVCRPVVCKTTPQPRSCCRTKNWGGWNIVIDMRYRNGNVKTERGTITYPNKHRPRPQLPQLEIPFGFKLTDGTYTDKVPSEYYDSKGKKVKVKKEFVGMVNKSQAYKKKPNVTYSHWKEVRR